MSSKVISVLVVEDEVDIRKELIHNINKHPDLKVIGEAEDADSAFSAMVQLKPDCVFLDIVLLESDAFVLIEKLQKNKVKIPPIVLNTGFSDFEFAKKIAKNNHSNIIYLMEKPFYEEWDYHLSQIISAVHEQQFKINKKRTHISLSEGSSIYRVNVNQICSIRVLEKGSGKCSVFLPKSKDKGVTTVFDINITLIKLLKQLPEYFLQLSRDLAINGNKVVRYDRGDQVLFMEGEHEAFGVTLTYKDAVLEFLQQ
jgi:DNA-binding LytR/AlgR family response regulator